MLLLVLGSWHVLRITYVKIRRSAVCGDLDQIRLAVIRYETARGVMPDSLDEIAPAFVPSERIHTPARYGALHHTILVPPDPFELRRTTNGFEVCCAFYGRNYTRVVMDARGNIRSE